MVLKSDQQRIRDLLSQAIPMMCKNGLAFKTEFCIEALVGITLDNNDVFLVNIKETFRSEEEEETAAASEASVPGPGRTRKRTRKRRRSSEDAGSPNTEIKQENETSLLGTSDQPGADEKQRGLRNKRQSATHTGDDVEKNASESNVVIIKDEPNSDNELEAALWLHDKDIYSEQLHNVSGGVASGSGETFADHGQMPGAGDDYQDFITFAAPGSGAMASHALDQHHPSSFGSTSSSASKRPAAAASTSSSPSQNDTTRVPILLEAPNVTISKIGLSKCLLGAGQKPEKLLRLLLREMFTDDQLANGSALGYRTAHNNTGEKSTALDRETVDVLKQVVLQKFPQDSGCPVLTDTQMNAIINSKCGTVRRAIKKLNQSVNAGGAHPGQFM